MLCALVQNGRVCQRAVFSRSRRCCCLSPARPAMLPYSSNASLSDLSANGLLEDKFPSPHFYVRQPHCLQIIQLVEADAPPPPKVSSVIDTSSWASSSDYSSEYSESATSEDDEEEEACSSYCSSDASPEELEASTSEHSKFSSSESSDTYSLRIKRILAWREDFYSQAQSAISGASFTLSSSDLTLTCALHRTCIALPEAQA